MSSTTRARGQVVVLFAISAAVILMFASLAFDVGMVLVEQRDQQDAADAAALAGARFLPSDAANAEAAAVEIARRNGFEDGVAAASVEIAVGTWTPAGGFVAGGGTTAIEVRVSATRPSVFAGVLGRTGWDVSTRSVAVNVATTSGAFAMLTLDPSACRAFIVEGSGVVTSHGNIQVNSTCDTGQGAFRVAGTGSLSMIGDAIGCNVVGGDSYGGGVDRNDCDPATTGAVSIPDPYATLSNPDVPGLPAAMVRWNTVADAPWTPAVEPPAGCPGSSTPATAAAPMTCLFGGSHAGETWRIYPGLYPGGVNLGGATFLMEPGVYYMAGGGFRAANTAILSVDPGGHVPGGGVLIFNGTDPAGIVAPAAIVLQGGSAAVELRPLVGDDFPGYAAYDRMVIFQDRTVNLAVQVVGGNSTMAVRGIIYAPDANIAVRGNAGDLTLDQLIGRTIEARGNGGSITIAYDEDYLPHVRYAGLVE